MVGFLDFVAFGAAMVIFVMYIVAFVKDIKYFSEIDPPKKF